MLVVHMFCTALDNPAPATIVLISGDVDFALPLAALRLRRYHIVLMLPEGRPVNVMLKASAHRVCVLNDVLFPPGAPSASLSAPTTPLRSTLGATTTTTPTTTPTPTTMPTTLVPLSVQTRRSTSATTLLTPQSLLFKASPPSASTAAATTTTTSKPNVTAAARSRANSNNNNDDNDDDDDENDDDDNDDDDGANEVGDDELLHEYEIPASKIRFKNKVSVDETICSNYWETVLMIHYFTQQPLPRRPTNCA